MIDCDLTFALTLNRSDAVLTKMNRWKKQDPRILPPLRSDGSAVQKPQRLSALPLDVMAFSEVALKRFWAKVRRSDENQCWLWLGAMTHDGYGRFGLNRGQIMAHRMSFRIHVGEIPDDLCVCHSCDNPPCCNPKHLWLGTQWDNALDKVAKGRSPVGDRNGMRKHPESVLRGDRHPFRTNPKCHAFGEGVNTAKLRSEDVIRIRRLYKTGKYSMMSLARRFGCSHGNITCIIENKTWKHLL